MKKTFFAVAIVCGLAVVSCNESNNKSDEKTGADTSASSKDIAPLNDSLTQNEITDPDPTDTIPANAYGITTCGKATEELVRTTLNKLYKDDLSKEGVVDDYSKKFIFFEYDLNGDSAKEILVGLTGPYFCGSGGCTILLLDNKGGLITRFTVTEYPVVIASTTTNGWKDLILNSNRNNRLAKYNGKTYPSNPSVLPVFKTVPGDELPRALDFTREPYPWFKF